LASGASPARRGPSRPPPAGSPGPGRRRGPCPTEPSRRGDAPARNHAQAPGSQATSGARSAPAARVPRGRHTGAGQRLAGATGTRRRRGMDSRAPRCRRPSRGAAPPSSSLRCGERHPSPEGARPRWRRPVPRRVVRPSVVRRPPRGDRLSGLRRALPGLVLPPTPWCPTPAVSRRQKRRRSAAEPKLEAVGSSAMLGRG
jgi:hypothetical protein